MTVALRIRHANVEGTDADDRLVGARTRARAVARGRRHLDPLGRPRGPFPGRADAFWLAGYPVACAGLALLLRARVRGTLGPTMWLDGAIAAAAVASLVAAAAPGRGAGAIAYPLGDVLLLCLAAGATALLGRRAGRTFGLVAAGLALCAVADAARLLEGVEVRAPLAALVLACAAALPAETRRRSAPVGGAHVGLPAAFTLAALGVLLWDRQVAPLSDPAIDLALAVPFLLVLRLAVSLRENNRLLERSRDEALTDSPHRPRQPAGADARALRRAGGRPPAGRPVGASHCSTSTGSRRYNDAFGHPAGDALMSSSAAGWRGRGGRGPRVPDGRRRVLRAGLAERATVEDLRRRRGAGAKSGQGFRINTAFGGVELPGDAADAEAALQLADRRMYAQKGAGRDRPRARPATSCCAAARARARAARATSRRGRARRRSGRARAEAEQPTTVVRAAELHDVGKVAVPDAILTSPARWTRPSAE